MGGGSKNKVPEDWEIYTNIGDVVPGTNIVPFKVPLNASILSRVPRDSRWGLQDLKVQKGIYYQT